MSAANVPPTLRLHADDNVVIARRLLAEGSAIAAEKVTTTGAVGAGHKVAARPIAKDDAIIRYGQTIGFASRDIAPGEHVHVHNMEMRSFARDHAFGADARPTAFVDPPATFEGIRRADGRVATRNYIGIISSVNCSATVAQAISSAFRRNPWAPGGDVDPLADFANVDGVVALTHKSGCGMQTDGDGLATLRRTIAGYTHHVNFSHVILIGLGCESNQLDELVQVHRLNERRPSLPVLTIQAQGGTRKTIEHAIGQIRELLPEANAVKREAMPLSHLTVGLQCGGSDGYSGITANPALGVASDLVVRNGGSVILAETPESYGAEHLLTRRAVSPEVGEKMMQILSWWEDYTAKHGGNMDNNPSPGNKAGGLTTILEKSLGAVAKGGSTNLVDVLRYGEPLKHRGFNFMDSPGYDPVSVTGEVASGANLVCFTTGRGSVYGCVPAPSLKLATNTPLYQRMAEDMDINCGAIIDGEETVEACGQRIFDLMVATASGRKSRSEGQGFGEAEFAPWPLGTVM